MTRAELEAMALAHLDAPRRMLTWATVFGGTVHAWDLLPPDGISGARSICGAAVGHPDNWVSGPTDIRCPDCARLEADPLTELLAKVAAAATASAALVLDAEIAERARWRGTAGATYTDDAEAVALKRCADLVPGMRP